jgi:polyisoprenoid-binding protein YceI
MVKIRVTGFKNPIDSSEVTGFEVTSMVKAANQYYPIDPKVSLRSKTQKIPLQV